MRKIQSLVCLLVVLAALSGCAGVGKVKPLEEKTGVKEKAGTEVAVTAQDVKKISAPEAVKKTMTSLPEAAGKNMTSEDAKREMNVKRPLMVRKRLIYRIAWNGIPVGRIIGETQDIIDYRGRKVYVATLKTESNVFLSMIYRVADTYLSYVDVEDMSSRRYEADRKEGRYRKHVVVEYDFDSKEAIYTNHTDGSVKRCSITEPVHDPVSAMCYFMTLPVKQGDKVHVTINLNEKNYELYSIVEDLGLVKLPRLGEYSAFRIKLHAFLNGKEYRKGNAWMYFATGEKRLPLYGEVKIRFGKITATLCREEDI